MGAAQEGKQSTPVGGGVVTGHLAITASGEEIMAIIFISPTCWLSPPCKLLSRKAISSGRKRQRLIH